jgi:hypothetical protein
MAGGARAFTTTERNWLLALAIVVGSGLLFGLVLAVEQCVSGAPREERLVWHGAETSMRFLALSHFLVAALYSLTSRRMRGAKPWGWWFGLLGLGVLLCVGFSRLGALGSPVAAALFYAYFLVHEFRDEAMFYGAYGDAPAEAPSRSRWKDVYVAPLLVLGLIAAVFVAGAAFRIGGARRYTDAAFGSTPEPVRWALGLVPAAAVAVAAFLWKRRYDATHPGGTGAFLRANRPIFFVFVGIFVVLLADIVVTGRVYAIVTLHVTVWYVFVLHQLRSRPPPEPPPRPFTWAWARTTPAGFNFVHLSVAALVIGAGALWAYGFRNDPGQDALRVLLSREAFPYWTVMHVTLSFVPLPK